MPSSHLSTESRVLPGLIPATLVLYACVLAGMTAWTHMRNREVAARELDGRLAAVARSAGAFVREGTDADLRMEGLAEAFGVDALQLFTPGEEGWTGSGYGGTEGTPVDALRPLLNGVAASGMPMARTVEDRRLVLAPQAGRRGAVLVAVAEADLADFRRAGRVELQRMAASAGMLFLAPLPLLGLMLLRQHRELRERLRLEKRMREAQKFESVGQLAGGIAHDFNNMLSIMMGAAEIARMKLDRGEPVEENLLQIQNAAKRSTRITRQLRAFARQETISPVVMDLNEAVGLALKMLRRMLGEDVEMEWRPGPDLCPVKMDPGQLDQILVNLCVNAREFLRDNGRIRLSTEHLVLEEPGIFPQEEVPAGDYAVLKVADNGRGLPASALERVFEPFYPIEEDASRGTGLGLSTVYGIVKQHGGYVALDSRHGVGTEVLVFLPACEAEEAGERPEVSKVEIPRGGGETILLVEDDRFILELAAQMLSDLGYEVLAYDDPKKALAEMKSRRGRLDLVMSDVVMPQISGHDLVEALAKRFPRVKVLFMSGYPSFEVARHGVHTEKVHFIEKPFTRNELAVKVRELLDE